MSGQTVQALLNLQALVTEAAQRHPEDWGLAQAVEAVDAALAPYRSAHVVLAENKYPLNPDRVAAQERMDAILAASEEQTGRWPRILQFIANHMPSTGDDTANDAMMRAAAKEGLLIRIPEVGPKYTAMLCKTFGVEARYDNNYAEASPASFTLFMREYIKTV